MPRPVIRTLAAAALSLALALPASGQQVLHLKDAGNVAAFGYYVGPYHGLNLSTGPGGPVIDLFCVDFLHEVWIGETWTAYLTPLAWNLNGRTRGGNAGLTQYRKAAWLTTQFASAPASAWGDIHASIWQIMTPGAPGEPTPSSGYWMNQANTHYMDGGAAFYNRFVLATPTNMAQPGSAQEFLTTATPTPEPSELILFGSGLAGMALLLVRRRRLAKR
jgi:hypothetical protein